MLYRFRSIDKLIGEKYEELKKQYFYFSSPASLNDPLEGYVDFYWKADKIAWLGLFKNYVWKLFSTLVYVSFKMPFEDITKIHFSRTGEFDKDSDYYKIRFDLESEFANEELINEIATILSKANKEISRDVLEIVFILIHYLALFHANTFLERYGARVFKSTDWINKNADLKRTTQHIETIELLNSFIVDNESAEKIHILSQKNRFELATKSNISSIPDFEIMEYLVIDFPENFVNNVVTLAFYDWQVVCFNRNYSDPKMWSHYAYNHEGVCLIFDFKDTKCVDLESLDTSSKDRMCKLHIKPVDYKSPPSRINFFLTLGNLWGDERMHWLYHNDEMSNILKYILENTENWRNNYWTEYEKRFLRKGESWAYEEEERIVLEDSFYAHSRADARKYKYDFDKLHGVIFGIKTKLSDKKKIIEILQEKCNENKREQFHIYQARYDNNKEIIEKDLIMIIRGKTMSD